jgi:hypothetical protein
MAGRQDIGAEVLRRCRRRTVWAFARPHNSARTGR